MYILFLTLTLSHTVGQKIQKKSMPKNSWNQINHFHGIFSGYFPFCESNFDGKYSTKISWNWFSIWFHEFFFLFFLAWTFLKFSGQLCLYFKFYIRFRFLRELVECQSRSYWCKPGQSSICGEPKKRIDLSGINPFVSIVQTNATAEEKCRYTAFCPVSKNS